jgi:Domain of unknown function (DUF3526)
MRAVARQVRTVFRNELTLLSRNRVLWIVIPLIALSVWYALAAGADRIRQARAAEGDFLLRARQNHVRHQELARTIERRIADGTSEEQWPPPWGTRHPGYVAAWNRPPVILPPSSFEWLAVGSSDLYAPGFFGPEHDEISQIQSPRRMLAGYLDLAFLTIYGLPMLLVAVFYSSNQAGREGPDRLAVSQGIRIDTLIWIRAAVAAVTVLGAGVFCALLALPAMPGEWTISAIARVGLAFAAITIYGLFWLGLATVVERHGSAGASALGLFALWLLVVVLIPLAIHQTAVWLRPVPPHADVLDAIRAAPERARSADQRKLLAAFLARHPDYPQPDNLAPLGRMYLEGAARNEARDEWNEAAERRVWDAAAAQQSLVDSLSVISPAALLQRCLVGLAGTDRGRYENFLRQKEAYDAAYLRFFNLRKFALPDAVFRADEYDLIPMMHYREEPIHAVLRRITWAVLFLASHCVLVLGIASALPITLLRRERRYSRM